jgi:hypothetical protein
LGQLLEYFQIRLHQSRTAGFHHRQGNRRGRVAISLLFAAAERIAAKYSSVN